MKLKKKNSVNHQAGFTLVEIMVGMVVGLLVTLVIVQAMSVFEGQRRSTSGTSDAQTNGGIALYNIGRELQFAGYSLMPAGKAGQADSPLECTTVTPDAAAETTGMSVAANEENISPVTITNGGVSDAITIRYGDSLSGGIPTPIKSTATGLAIPVTNNLGCRNNDLVVIINGATCTLNKLAAAGLTGIDTVNLKAGETVPAIVPGVTNLSCLGNWHTVTYAANPAGNLERQDLATTPVDAATPLPGFVENTAGIVNIQAQYGVSATAGSNQINQWVDATGAWATPSVADRNRIKAVRIAVVARNPKIEPNAVTAACDAATNTGLCAWRDVPEGGAIAFDSPAPLINLADDADWTRYRYRVYETIIPLRNMIWSKDTL